MTVTLHLSPAVEAGIVAQAQASGMTVEEYLLSIVENTVLSPSEKLSVEERATAFEAWSARHRHTAPLSDYPISREGMYEGRDP